MSTAATAIAITKIRAYAASFDGRASDLAKLAGLSVNTLRKLFDADWNPTADTLLRLEKLIPADFDPSAAQSADGERVA